MTLTCGVGISQQACSDRPLFSGGLTAAPSFCSALRLESLQSPLTPASPTFPTCTLSPHPTDFTNFLLHLPEVSVFRQDRSPCEDHRSSSTHRLSPDVTGLPPPPPPDLPPACMLKSAFSLSPCARFTQKPPCCLDTGLNSSTDFSSSKVFPHALLSQLHSPLNTYSCST